MKLKSQITVVLSIIMFYCYGQDFPFIKVGDEKLGITSLNVDVEVLGNIATTTYDMQFYNPTNQVLEGELNFPLGEGQNVVRLALDINGVLREAVIVEKELGRTAFEAVVRRGVDPILLEKVTGNNYKARIYPIPANGHKRVVLAFDQTLKTNQDGRNLFLPLQFNKKLDEFSIKTTIYSHDKAPIIKNNSIDLNFSKTALNYSGSLVKKDYLLNKNVEITIPLATNQANVIRDENYFYLSDQIEMVNKERLKPKNIRLIWDASLSMEKRELAKEFELLDKYFTYLKNSDVELVVFSNTIIKEQKYTVVNGDWSDLRATLKNTIYDGGTNYSKLKQLILDREDITTLFFTDLMNNLSDSDITFSGTLFVVNSMNESNHELGRNLVDKKGGAYINLTASLPKDAMRLLQYEKVRLLSIETDNKAMEIYPKEIKNIFEGINISGSNFKTGQKIKLTFGDGSGIPKLLEYTIPEETVVTTKLAKLFASNKIKYLQKSKEENKEEIIALSKKHNVISDFTSMIVLDDVRDYVKYKITPPAELKEEYDRLVKTDANFNTTSASNDQSDKKEEEIVEDIQGEFMLSGTVSDELGPVAEASITLKRLGTGTTTDIDGNFSLKVSMGDELVVSHVAYPTIETTIKARMMNIVMPSQGTALDEVVVTAMGVKSERKTLGYAVTTIKSEELENRAETDIARVLTGKVAGVQTNPAGGFLGSGTSVIIRSRTSITGDNRPLYVVDGVPISADRYQDIDPNNIHSLSVLRGLSATTRYGSEGRNGVILITTKSGGGDTGARPEQEVEEEITNKYKGELRVTKIKNKAAYLKPFKKLKSTDEYYDLYLKQREEYKDYPAYLIDLYDLFQEKGLGVYANRILSNLIELDIDNYEKLRVFAYKLEKTKQLELAVFVYKRILELRPEDSQSYRDLALVYSKMDRPEKSSELLYDIVSEALYKDSHRRNFKGVNNISKRELVQLVSTTKELKDDETLSEFNKKELYDLRVVIDWNHNDTDIDLHIIDPNREECYYSNNKTRIGGLMSQDMTQGFGPEEYRLKKAIKGNYFVMINYYGDRYQKIENPTFIKVTIFKNYGRKSQTEKVKVIRLSGKKDKYILAKVVI